MTDSASLRVGDRVVAEYAWRPDLPLALAPRPYLHPVRTLAGTVVTEAMPSSHRHHLGVSVAVADVDGGNFWGGRTYVPGHGPAWLDNHGTQEHVRWVQQRPDRLTHTLRWTAIDREQLLTERRTLTAHPLDAGAWVLGWEFALTNTTGRPLGIRSPAALGRAGAGFGGFFWRLAADARGSHVTTATGAVPASGVGSTSTSSSGSVSGSGEANGARSPWLLLTAPAWTLLFIGATDRTREDRWFVRTRDYAGVGSALAWDDPLVLTPGETLTRRLVVLVADGTLTAQQAAARAAELAS